MARRILLAVLVVLLVGVGAFVAYAWRAPLDPVAPPPRTSFNTTSVVRGASLAAIGGCVSCHTAPGGHPYAGGLPLETPFGTIYGTNITPDPDTGIGRWSQAAFVRAMREGVDREGRHLYPAFPYDHFTRVAEDDLHAIYAFLMTREPVRAQTPENDLPFPLNIRMLVAGWKLLYFDREGFRRDPAQTAEWNRGAYLAEGLGHCSSCHTPRNFLGAQKKRLHFAGGLIEGWRAPALDTSSRAPVPWTVEALQTYLRDGVSEVHEVSAGPMTRVVHNLGEAPEEEVRAIATYVASRMGPVASDREALAQQALERARAAADKGDIPQKLATGGEGSDTIVQDGRLVYEGTCMLCHGAARRPPGAASSEALHLTLSTSIHLPTPNNLIRIVLQGMAPRDGEAGPFMPGYAGALTDDQIAALVTYLRSDFTDRPAWQNVTREVRRIRQSFAHSH
ncbi:MAG: c-type cytochrome [Burkholderiales bacterium]